MAHIAFSLIARFLWLKWKSVVVNGNVLDTRAHHVALVSKSSFLQLFLGFSELCIRVIVEFM